MCQSEMIWRNVTQRAKDKAAEFGSIGNILYVFSLDMKGFSHL
jgi:hypothetical protein